MKRVPHKHYSPLIFYILQKGQRERAALTFSLPGVQKKEKDHYLLHFPLWCKGKECSDPYPSILIEQALKGVLCAEKGSLVLQNFLFSNAAPGPVCPCAVSGEFYSGK